MNRFIYGDELSAEIDSILAEESCRCAVAFWGRGAHLKLSGSRSDFRIVCNLRMGGTNPTEIEKLPRDKVKQSDVLHAKVYIGKERAVVASANASANGLGLEGMEQAKWIEAGVLLKSVDDVARWFEQLWNAAATISDQDLERAKRIWRARRSTKPPLQSFKDFDPEQTDNPLLYWVSSTEWEYNPKVLKKWLGNNGDSTQLIDSSLEVELGDSEAMKQGTWIIVWETISSVNQMPTHSKRRKPVWFMTDRIIEKAFRYTKNGKAYGSYRDAVLESVTASEPPFDISEPGVRESIIETLSEDKYEPLRERTDGRGFFTPVRMKLIKEFWPDCKKRYLAGTPKMGV